jgi:hypothetical protein
MTLRDYLQTLENEERAIIEEKINKLIPNSPVMLKMVSNLYLENCFEMNDCKELADSLLNSSSETDTTELIIRDFCRANRSLKGEEAKIPNDKNLGRIISFDRFCELLVELETHTDIDEAKEYVRSIIDLPLDEAPDEWKDVELGIFLMWSTFNENEKRPFGENLPKISTILCSLGLPFENKPHLLFEYILPDEIKPHIPTFFDAYAGCFWTKFFHRASPGLNFGYTMPTEEDEKQKPRPEVVHKPIKAKCLVEKLRYA